MNRPRRIVFFTGAGISADSGIPTFRQGVGALWNNVPVEQVCYIEHFERNYDQVHAFYNAMRTQLKDYEPNRAHQAIAQLQSKYGAERVIVITSNVDDLHERAGAQALHIHGDLQWMQDRKTGERFHVGYDAFEVDAAADGYRYKPDVVFFGEQAPAYRPMQEIIDSLYRDDLVVTVGSSHQVVPFPMMVGMASGEQVPVWDINPEVDPSCFVRRGFRLGAADAFAEDGDLVKDFTQWLEHV